MPEMSTGTNYDAFVAALPELTSLFYNLVQPGIGVGEVPFIYIKAFGLTQDDAAAMLGPLTAGFFKNAYGNAPVNDILMQANRASHAVSMPFARNMESLYPAYYVFRDKLEKTSGGYSSARQEGTLRFLTLVSVLVMNQEYALEKLGKIPLEKKGISNPYNNAHIWRDAIGLLQHLRSYAEAKIEPVPESAEL